MIKSILTLLKKTKGMHSHKRMPLQYLNYAFFKSSFFKTSATAIIAKLDVTTTAEPYPPQRNPADGQTSALENGLSIE